MVKNVSRRIIIVSIVSYIRFYLFVLKHRYNDRVRDIKLSYTEHHNIIIIVSDKDAISAGLKTTGARFKTLYASSAYIVIYIYILYYIFLLYSMVQFKNKYIGQHFNIFCRLNRRIRYLHCPTAPVHDNTVLSIV